MRRDQSREDLSREYLSPKYPSGKERLGKERSIARQLLDASQVGLNLVVATFVGFFIGRLLDAFFKTSPYLTVIFLFLGIIAGFRELYRAAKKTFYEDEKDGEKTP